MQVFRDYSVLSHRNETLSPIIPGKHSLFDPNILIISSKNFTHSHINFDSNIFVVSR